MNAPHPPQGQARTEPVPESRCPGLALAPIERRIPDCLNPPIVLSRHVWPLGHLVLWWNRLAARHELSQLAEHQTTEALKDMGLTRRQLLQEVRRPFWEP